MDRFADQSSLALLVAFVLGVVAVARLTRLAIYDSWPPVKWVRERYLAWAEQTRGVPAIRARQGHLGAPGYEELTWRAGWAPLATCPFCLAPWFALVSLGWAWWSQLEGPWGTAWWLTTLFLSASYLASMIVVRDEPEES